MSQQLINRSPDLKQLRDEGYDIEIRHGHLLIKNVPYVTSGKTVRLGTLVSELTLAGDVTAPPGTHVALFEGEHPCNKDGTEITKIKHASGRQQLGDNLVVDHSFSSKPLSGGYTDYYEKMTTYVAIILSQAQAIDPNVKAKVFSVIEAEEAESVFKYID